VTVPAFDFYSVCSALGSAFAPGTIGTPTSESAMRAVYPHGVKSIPAYPAIVLQVSHGEVVGNSDNWSHKAYIDAILLLSKRPGNPVTVEASRQRWLPYMLSATETHLKLGVGAQTGWELKSAMPIGWEWAEVNVDDDPFDGIRVHYEVWIYETMSNLAP